METVASMGDTLMRKYGPGNMGTPNMPKANLKDKAKKKPMGNLTADTVDAPGGPITGRLNLF
jgi:hypothetical protein